MFKFRIKISLLGRPPPLAAVAGHDLVALSRVGCWDGGPGSLQCAAWCFAAFTMDPVLWRSMVEQVTVPPRFVVQLETHAAAEGTELIAGVNVRRADGL